MAYTTLDIIQHPENYLPNIQVDNVILGYHDKELKVLLQQTIATNKWSITGGYVGRAESIDEAANRIALSRTGLENLFLQQFRSFGGVSRSEDPEKNAANMSKLTGVTPNLITNDIDRATAFYRDLLGMKLLFEVPPQLKPTFHAVSSATPNSSILG